MVHRYVQSATKNDSPEVVHRAKEILRKSQGKYDLETKKYAKAFAMCLEQIKDEPQLGHLIDRTLLFGFGAGLLIVLMPLRC